MSISNERMNQYIGDALRVLEVKGDTDAEGAPLREAPTITDEMVERAAEALYRQEFGSGWDEDPTEGEKDEFRDEARRILEVALGEWVV